MKGAKRSGLHEMIVLSPEDRDNFSTGIPFIVREPLGLSSIWQRTLQTLVAVFLLLVVICMGEKTRGSGKWQLRH